MKATKAKATLPSRRAPAAGPPSDDPRFAAIVKAFRADPKLAPILDAFEKDRVPGQAANSARTGSK